MDETRDQRKLEPPPPEIPEDPMEFLSRSWSASALEVTKAIGTRPPLTPFAGVIHEDLAGELEEAAAATVAGNAFAFASSATSQLVMERIMSQSAMFQEMRNFVL